MPFALILSLVVLLANACGSDSSGPTGSSQVLAGTYRGTVNLTATAGPASVSRSGPAVVTVSPAQIVTVGNFPGSAPVVGNSFTLPVPASTLNGPGLTCPQGTIVNAGTFAGTTVNGTVSSSGMVCNGIPAGLTGSFTATLQAEVRRDGADTDVTATFRSALIRALGGL